MYLGTYRLLNLIATGQSTQVYEAMHDGERRRVAVKVVLSDSRTKQQIALLRREFEVGRKLDHPHIIKLIDYGITRGGDAYLLMELFNHPNLKQHIQQGAEALWPVAATIVKQGAEALAYMAEKDLVHCDIKPENFLVDKATGELKLIDFALVQKSKTGLAALFGGAKSLQGTPSYMSPEQIRRKALTPKSDVYSYGCTIFELVTGKRVFTGLSMNELLNRHLRAVPPPMEIHNRNVTAEFSELVKHMLAKEPNQRPAMSDVLVALQRIALFKSLPAARVTEG